MRHSDEPFDLEAWLQSVEGHTVRVTAPDADVLGYEASRLVSSPTIYTVPYCEACDEYVRLVRQPDEDSPIGHCPGCGRKPGALELGTRQEA